MITRKSPEELSKQLIKVTFTLEIANEALMSQIKKLLDENNKLTIKIQGLQQKLLWQRYQPAEKK